MDDHQKISEFNWLDLETLRDLKQWYPISPRTLVMPKLQVIYSNRAKKEHPNVQTEHTLWQTEESASGHPLSMSDNDDGAYHLVLLLPQQRLVHPSA